jgi:alkyl hydroperoxide reductase subunit AhpC
MHDDVKGIRGPSLGEPAPFFETDIAGNKISLHDFKGRWIVIISHPEDLLPVFKTRTINYVLCKRRTKVIALGNGITAVVPAGKNPVKKYVLRHNLTIADDTDGRIGAAYGLSSGDAESPDEEKGVFIVDPKGILRVKLYLPQAAERSFYDMLKLIDALQMTDGQKVRSSEKAGWRRKLNVVVRPKVVPDEGSAG